MLGPRLRVPRLKASEIHNGEALATAHVPSQSVYELTGVAGLPLLTAVRVEVPPLDEANARHTPEEAFIVDSVRAFVVRPNGQKDKIAFAYFLQDSETNLEDRVLPNGPAIIGDQPAGTRDAKKGTKEEVADGFAAERKLFRTRWIVGVPSAPLQLAPNSRIEVDLKQTQDVDSKPAIIKRVRLAISGDPRWTTLRQDPERAQSIVRLKELEQQLAKIPSVPLPVMVEQSPFEQRATREFERGNFLTKVGPDLAPDVPGIFPGMPAGVPHNRLTLAQWFFSPGQPLTARVAVNRYWEELFGTGIVETLENFGSVGEGPSHPELLDWLALHFQNDLHWDMKALLRELVTSATYRQNASSTPALTKRDPRNRLLARGPQQRLSAEMVRDQALVASGLLSHTMGGPPVMPPQPAGVWNSVYNNEVWKDATGPDRYRRAIYTFIKRTSGYPSFQIFDASDRDTSLPRRISTNTPLQALVTLNDPVYHEAAKALAQRVIKETRTTSGSSADGNPDARLIYETPAGLISRPHSRRIGGDADVLCQKLLPCRRIHRWSGQASLCAKSLRVRKIPVRNRLRWRQWAAFCLILMPHSRGDFMANSRNQAQWRNESRGKAGSAAIANPASFFALVYRRSGHHVPEQFGVAIQCLGQGRRNWLTMASRGLISRAIQENRWPSCRRSLRLRPSV